MRKLWFLLLLFLFVPNRASEQGQGYTRVFATGKTCYANGSVQAGFINQSNSPTLPLLNGSTFPQSGVTNFDSAGNFSFYLADNLQIFPTPTQWSITACAQSGGQPACGTMQITVTGAQQDITSSINPMPCPGGGTQPGGQAGAVQYKKADGSLGGSTSTYDDQADVMYNDMASNKGPTVDVTHQSFATAGGCQKMDKTGVQDVTCNVRAAAAYASSQAIVSGVTPTLYFPSGKYRIDAGEIRPTAFMAIKGDGSQATQIILTNATSNLFTLNAYVAGAHPCNWCGFAVEDVTLVGNGHLTGGNLIEISQNILWRIRNVNFLNHGGRALQINNSERGTGENLSIYDVRWPIVATGAANEIRFRNVNIQGGETDSGTYSYNINAVNGVYPSANSGVCSNYPSWQPNTQYVEGSLTCDPNGNIERATLSGYVNVSTNVYVIGTSGASAPAWPAGVGTTVADNGGGNAHDANTTTTNPGITWTNEAHRTPLRPDYHASVTVTYSQAFSWESGSIKSTQHQSGMSLYGENMRVASSYIECFVGHCPNPSIAVDMTERFPFPSGIAAGATVDAVSNWQWAANLATNPSDVLAYNNISANEIILPPDYSPTSSAPSSCGGGLLQNQYENVNVRGFASDGNVYFNTRRASGTTAPANYAWCANAFMLASGPGVGFSQLRLTDTHIAGDSVTESAGWTTTCGDQNFNNVCKDILLGPVWDGQVYPYYGTGGLASYYGKQVMLTNTAARFGDNANYESVGQGILGCLYGCSVTVIGNSSLLAGSSVPMGAPGLLGQLAPAPYMWLQAIYAPTGPPIATFDVPGQFHLRPDTQLADLTSRVGNPPGLGNHYYVYDQFFNSRCWADVQLTQSPFIRHCLLGGPNAWNGYQEVTQIWNGTAWVIGTQFVYTNAGTSTVSVNMAGLNNRMPFGTGANAWAMSSAGTGTSQNQTMGQVTGNGSSGGIGIVSKSNSGAAGNAFEVWSNDGHLLMSVGHNGNAILGTTSIVTTGTPTVGQAACIKAAGPPVVFGYCSTQPTAAGGCTCN